MSVIDIGGAVRSGEELDIAAVEQWLKAQGMDLQGTARVTQYSGGASPRKSTLAKLKSGSCVPMCWMP